VLAHGILTRTTRASWPDELAAWLHGTGAAGHVRVVSGWYYELPLPRLAWWRNRRRAAALASRVLGHLAEEPGAEVVCVGHSNGCAIVHGLVRILLAAGHRVRAIVYSAAAVPARQAARDVRGWLEGGRLGWAQAWVSRRDRVLGLVRLVPGILTWPWGHLGRTGWGEPWYFGMSMWAEDEAGHGGWWEEPLVREARERVARLCGIDVDEWGEVLV
jgi:hypothetical protein